MKRLFFSFFTVAALLMAGCGKGTDTPGTPGNPDDPDIPVNPDIPAVGDYESLKGSNYIPVLLDTETFASLGSKVIADARINDTTVEGNVYNGSINCWHWIPAFTEMDCTGPNSYGVLEGWMAYTISGAAGWFGIGIEASTSDTIVGVGRDNESLKLDASAIAELKAKASAALQAVGSMDESYSLHLSLMSQRAGVYCFKLYDGIIDGCPVTIGASEGEGDFWFPRDGEWHEIEVPMSFFINKGLNLANIKSLSACNIIALTQPETGTWPTDLNLDAVFFYQPAK